jgi:CysZ protein
LIRQYGSWKWIWLPGIIYALFFAVCVYLFYTTSGNFSNYIIKHTYIKEWLQSNNQFLSFLFVTSAVMMYLLVLIFYFSLFRILCQLVCAPLFAYISRRTYTYAGGAIQTVAIGALWKDVRRLCTLRNTLWQTVYFIALIILSLVPVIGWVTPLAGLLTECHYSGYPMMDLACTRREKAIRPTTHFISLHKGLATGNGLVFYILVTIPVAGWIVAPVYAVVAATLTANKLVD